MKDPTTLKFRRHPKEAAIQSFWRRWVIPTFFLPLALAAGLALAADPPAERSGSSHPGPEKTLVVELRGRLVCLAEEMHRVHQAELPSRHEHLHGFKTQDGKYYTLLRTRLSEALFVEPHLQQEELIITGRIFPDTHILDVVRLRSLHNGVLCDVVYYCSVCAIESVTPGTCMCCQEPVELQEKPLGKGP
jgi:hypothetical protein